jgi:hypothetical protein
MNLFCVRAVRQKRMKSEGEIRAEIWLTDVSALGASHQLHNTQGRVGVPNCPT